MIPWLLKWASRSGINQNSSRMGTSIFRTGELNGDGKRNPQGCPTRKHTCVSLLSNSVSKSKSYAEFLRYCWSPTARKVRISETFISPRDAAWLNMILRVFGRCSCDSTICFLLIPISCSLPHSAAPYSEPFRNSTRSGRIEGSLVSTDPKPVTARSWLLSRTVATEVWSLQTSTYITGYINIGFIVNASLNYLRVSISKLSNAESSIDKVHFRTMIRDPRCHSPTI